MSNVYRHADVFGRRFACLAAVGLLGLALADAGVAARPRQAGLVEVHQPAAAPSAGAPRPWAGSAAPDQDLGNGLPDAGGTSNTSNGNHLLEIPLVGWSARGGLPVQWTLFHNSQSERNGPLGPRWTHSYDLRLTVDAATGEATVLWGDDLADTYTRNANGSFTPPVGVFHTLTASGSDYLLVTRNQVTLRFAPQGGIWLCAQIQDRNGNAVALARNGTGALTSVVDPSGRTLSFAYDATGKIRSVTDPIGRSWTLTYGAAGDLTRVDYPAVGASTPGMSLGYNAGHDLVQVSDLRGKVWNYTYNSDHSLASTRDPLGNTTSFAYTANQTRITDPLGRITRHNFDTLARLVSVVDAAGQTTAYGYDAAGNLASLTEPGGFVWRSTYDARGNRLTARDPLGNVTSWTYTARNDVLTATSPLGRGIAFAYDTSGNVVSVTDPAGKTSTQTVGAFGLVTRIANPLGEATSLAYDADGNRVAATNPLGQTIGFAFDPLGRLTGVSDAAGRSATLLYDGLGRISRFDAPGGRATQFTYDAGGNRLTQTDPLGKTDSFAYDDAGRLVRHTDPLGRTVAFGYDGAGNRTRFTDGRGMITAGTYSARNELTRIVYPEGTSESRSYDARGFLATRTDGRGVVATHAYDAAGRPTGVAYSEGTPPAAFVYDGDGRRTRMTDGSGATVYAFDAVGRVAGRTTPQGSVTFAYDEAGRMVTRTLAGVGATTFRYNAAGQLIEATAPGWQRTTYAYDTAGQLLSTVYPNGATETRTTDPVTAETRRIWHRSAAGATLARFDLTYDPRGLLTQELLADGTTIAYGYDDARQLVSESRSGAGGYAISYQYDPAGNRTRRVRNGIVEVSAYDAAGKLLSAGTKSYAYDAAGNVTAVANAATGQTIQLSWDAESRLKALSGAASAAYGYNGLGQRVTRTAAGASRALLYADDRIAAPVLSDGAASYVHGLELIGEVRGGVSRFVHTDRLGTARARTDAAQNVADTLESEAFGLPTAVSGTSASPLGFGAVWGYQSDPESGLALLGHRLYDPSAGRFLSRDPIRSGYNWRIYCQNDPVNGVDPTGLDELILIPIGHLPNKNGGITTGWLFEMDDAYFPIWGWPVRTGGFRDKGSPVKKGDPTRLPPGEYEVTNPRKRTNPGMVVGGVGFSLDLQPLFPTPRGDLRIHPDGGKPGTAGCIGLVGGTGEDMRGFFDWFKDRLLKRKLIIYVD